MKILQLPVTTSTNDNAKRAAEAGEPEGLVIHALCQTAGRGRQGREWESAEGNLYASLLLRPRCSPQEAGFYSFVAALAVYDAVRDFLPQADVQTKWPNDVLVGGKKISGILLEAAPIDNGMVDWLVIGIGINVLNHPSNGLYPATSLAAEASSQVSVQTVLETLLQHFEKWQMALKNGGFEPIRTAWLARAKTGPIVARLPHETINGDFEGLDERGSLILRLDDGSKKAISAADVFFPA
jgi:BirA family biotin operon repressor/biotin-[acetyl-CoA-carboxylase] ligase